MRNPSPIKLRTSTCRSSKPSAGSFLSPCLDTAGNLQTCCSNNMHQKLHQNLCMVTTFLANIQELLFVQHVGNRSFVLVVAFASFNIPPKFYPSASLWTSPTYSCLTQSCFTHAAVSIMLSTSISMWNIR